MGNGLGKVWMCKSPKSVVPAGLDPLSRGFVLADGTRRGKMEFGREFGPFGLQECSSGMKPPSSRSFGRL